MADSKEPTMFGLRQTVSLLLLGFGALLVLMGTMSLFIEPPEGVAPEAARSVTTIFRIGGVLGLGLIAWGIYLRCYIPRGESWPLWVTYVVLLGPLVGLAVFVGDEVVEMIGARLSRGEIRGTGKGLIGILLFLLGPIILLFRRRSPSKMRPGEAQQRSTEPGPGTWRFRPVGSLVFLAISAGIYGLANWLGLSFSVAGSVVGLLIFAVLAFRPLRNLVFYAPPPRLDQAGPDASPQPKAEPDTIN
jgi:hypothetical protein